MRRCAFLTLILLLPGTLLAQISVERTDPVIERKTFDPRQLPKDMPKLNPREAAVAQSFFGAESRVGGQVIETVKTESGHRASLRVDMVRMTLRMRVTIWLPTNSNPKLQNHEEGHRKLAEEFYRDAEPIARKYAEALMGQIITGTGPTADAAADSALKTAAEALGGRYLAQTDLPCGKAQDYYDEITAHGTNAVKEDTAIEQAIRRVKGSSADSR